MAITASVILEAGVQADGRKSVRERHTDQLGVKYERFYLALGADDLNVNLAGYAAVLNAFLPLNEIASNLTAVMTLGSLANPTLNYSTAAANFAALRQAYSTATQIQAVMIGDFLSTLTDAQLQAAFGLTAAQVTTLRTNKLTPAANLAASIRATTGQ